MRILKYALKNIIRNPFLSFSSILIIGLLALFVNIAFFSLFASQRFIESVNNRIAITMNFRDGFGSGEIQSDELISKLQSTFTGVTVEYISQESAFEILKARNPDLASLVEGSDENPLPNSIRVSNIHLSSYQEFNTFISSYQTILQYDAGDMNKKLLDYKSQYDRIDFIVRLLLSLQYGIYFLLGLFAFTVFAIIYMIIRNFVFFQRDEIRIIELVGGRPVFIYGPFVIQGGLYAGLSALLISLVLIVFLGHVSLDLVSGPIARIVLDFLYTLKLWVFYEVLLFCVIGMISAFIASYSYINSTIGE